MASLVVRKLVSQDSRGRRMKMNKIEGDDDAGGMEITHSGVGRVARGMAAWVHGVRLGGHGVINAEGKVNGC